MASNQLLPGETSLENGHVESEVDVDDMIEDSKLQLPHPLACTQTTIQRPRARHDGNDCSLSMAVRSLGRMSSTNE